MDKVRFGIIGVGGMGRSNLRNITDQNIVALCDVDQVRAAGAFNKFPDAKKFQDFRLMLEKMGSSMSSG